MNLKWRATWPDKANDGIATCDGVLGLQARVYLEAGGKHWYWFVNDTHARAQGIEDTKEEAKAAVQREFERIAREG